MKRKFEWNLIFFLGLCPFLVMIGMAFFDQLGANPVESLTHFTGTTTLLLLLSGLAINPLHRHFAWKKLVIYRRMIGLWTFFYATLHLLIYFGIDHRFSLDLIQSDLSKRRFVILGMLGYLILFLLAVTSSVAIMKKIGFSRWKALHRLVYLAAIFGVAHFFWLVKSDIFLPVIYGIILGVLLILRLVPQGTLRFFPKSR